MDTLKAENRRLESSISDLENDLGEMLKAYEDLTGRSLDKDSESIALELVASKAARSRARHQAEVLNALHTVLTVNTTTEFLRHQLALQRKRQEVESHRASLRMLTAEVEKKQRVMALLAAQR